ncbi:hypothetical protein DFH09DRAFT_1286308 [Mycena vulgaris]|nr:hypothetical protein DFH09DRAFT_1286308 [Mycena vulgaris]
MVQHVTLGRLHSASKVWRKGLRTSFKLFKDLVIFYLGTDVAWSFTWSSVNTIPRGYQIAAISNSAQFLVLSNSFKVVNGDGNSCRSKSSPVSAASSGIRVPAATTTSSSASSSSASGAASAQPTFNFKPISGMTNCTPATFSWVYGATTDSQPVDLRFIITSDVPGDSHLDQLITPEPINPPARSFTWLSVNTIPGGGTRFSLKVINSDVTSCRSMSAPVSASAQPQANDPKVNRETIAGGVVGGLFILIAAISVIPCQYRTRTRNATAPAEISPFTNHGKTVLALGRPVAPSDVESQEGMFEKRALMRHVLKQQ